ncbi:MAG: ATP-binding protein [Chitinophagales bacterium]|nr:ATP-binding protein [Chitinophagales bacterium]
MKDWGEVSVIFEEIHKKAFERTLENKSEAQTRFDVIDRVIKEILQWKNGQISVEPHTTGVREGYIDYLLISGDYKIIIEAKKVDAAFPSPTKRKKLKLTGAILGHGEINAALLQAEDYARNKEADIVMVTNGNCWCFYPLKETQRSDIYASLLFPFDDMADAEQLFNLFEVHNVENDSLKTISGESDVILNNKLNNIIDNCDHRLGRNNIADFIMLGIDHAIMAESLLNDEKVLESCYVTSDSRVKFDNTLHMHLSQYRPNLIEPAKRIRRDKQKDEFSEAFKRAQPNITSPVTLLIGSVGSGKSTYLKHFELVKSKELLKKQKAHWIYIDFEKLGVSGNPRDFIYNSLRDYLLEDHIENPTDFKNVIQPAYEKEIESLRRGPYALLSKNPEKFEEKITEIIDSDYQKVEPYVEKVYKYISSKQLCIIVIDNVDLYEDEKLETVVFSEAISISKIIKCNTIVSLRDSTYIKHKNTSIFNAYELKKFWVNPPSFREVLSRRLTYANQLLKGQKATIVLNNGSKLQVEDLGLFFKIVQKSVLNENNSKLLEYLSDRNPRKGITLIQNFLTSGHIHADSAINNYINGDAQYTFPFHEVFKGSILGQWKYFKEERSESYNIFDSSLGSKRLQLVRLYILRYLHNKAKIGLADVELNKLISIVSAFGGSDDIAKSVINSLSINSFIHSNNTHLENPSYNITLCGGYYITNLSKSFVYNETIIYDTNILDQTIFERLCNITIQIEDNRDIQDRLAMRKTRIEIFYEYLEQIENEVLTNTELQLLRCISDIKHDLFKEINIAISKTDNRLKRNTENNI